MKHLKILFFLAVAASAYGQLKSNQPMSHEEIVTRTAYARLCFAVQVEEIHKIEADAAGKPIDRAEFIKRLKASELGYELTDFKVRDLAAISNIKYSELVTKPEGGDALHITPGTWELTTDEPKKPHSTIATVQWGPQQSISENWEQPYGVVYPQTEIASQYDRFATFKVKVSFQDKSLSYRAMFLFGRDKDGQEKVLPIDTITNLNGSALNYFLVAPAYPGALIDGGLGKDPVIYDWLAARQVSGPNAKRGEANCDPVTLECSVHSDDLKNLKRLSRPTSRIQRSQPAPRLVNAGFHLPQLGIRPLFQATDCSKFNSTTAAVTVNQADAQLHITGQHVFTTNKSTSCTYSSGTNSNGLCNTSCTAPIMGMWSESGLVSTSCHQNSLQQMQGSATATGAGANCTGGAGGGVKACLLCMCNVSVSLSISGATVTVSSDGFVTLQDKIDNTCAAQTDPTNPIGGGGGGGGTCDPSTGSNCTTCLSAVSPTDGISSGGKSNVKVECNPGTSPIIIDYSGKGFFLTSAPDGVKFDIAGNGIPVQLGWTATGADNGFLALPGPTDVVTNGKQLFGNFTPQPASQRPNGFLALAVYDQPENGGNGDGVIDERDSIFSALRIWVDKNHDGVCQPEELFTLPSLGVTSISLKYALSHREDAFGNVFRYRAKANPDGQPENSDVGRWLYDVFLTTH